MLGPSTIGLAIVSGLLLAGSISADAVSDLWDAAQPNFEAKLASSKTCTKDKLQVRQEWGDLEAMEKKAYIDAVLCLTTSPSKLDQTKYPGAKTRYDDFVAVHINQTMTIHGTGNFLSWHRYYTWAYEQVLRNECGYNGTQPYWDWGRWAADPEASPLFDGSETSMSGNGEKTEHTSFMGGGGNGGGCLTSGPFKNMTANLGPISPAISPAPPRNPQRDGMGHNPRCLRRDIGNQLSSRYTRTEDIANLISAPQAVAGFQNLMQAAGGFGAGAGAGAGMGVHAAGHFTIAGDPAGDFYTSPGDPAFWFHHAMIDRTWAIWQMQDTSSRIQTIAGARSMMGGGQATLADEVNLYSVADTVYTIADLVSIVDGPFCYTYA
ncbi:Di-copper centre-containing protein [Xylariomycetidae sp. FL2044]|nr:Di-copper centre-containing protein [Xylariomycetidae sp. FL2044]